MKLESTNFNQLSSQEFNPMNGNNPSTPSNQNIKLSFETNAAFNYYAVNLDDFTPSHCILPEGRSTSSDIYTHEESSVHIRLSQIERFNPDLYEIEQVKSSQDMSPMGSTRFPS